MILPPLVFPAMTIMNLVAPKAGAKQELLFNKAATVESAEHEMFEAGNTKGGSIAVPLTSCLTGLQSEVLQIIIFVFICKTDYSKPVKQEVNGTVILPL